MEKPPITLGLQFPDDSRNRNPNGDGTYDFFYHCAKGFFGWHCQFEDDGNFVCFATHGHARLSNSFNLKSPV